MCPSFMVFVFKLDVSKLLNRVDKTVLCNRFCFFLIHRLLGLIVFFLERTLGRIDLSRRSREE